MVLAILLAAPAAHGLSRAYLCFFGLDSAELTDRSRMVAGAAVTAWQRLRQGLQPDYLAPGGPDTPAEEDVLVVYGYAEDASGSNDALSQRRAQAVADELIRRGVPARDVRAIGRGARVPLVPDSPLDPQNRRAEIVFQAAGPPTAPP